MLAGGAGWERSGIGTEASRSRGEFRVENTTGDVERVRLNSIREFIKTGQNPGAFHSTLDH